MYLIRQIFWVKIGLVCTVFLAVVILGLLTAGMTTLIEANRQGQDIRNVLIERDKALGSHMAPELELLQLSNERRLLVQRRLVFSMFACTTLLFLAVFVMTSALISELQRRKGIGDSLRHKAGGKSGPAHILSDADVANLLSMIEEGEQKRNQFHIFC